MFFGIVPGRCVKHTRQKTTNSMRLVKALPMYLKSTCVLSAVCFEIPTRLFLHNCCENHSGRNCVVEERRTANCVPQASAGTALLSLVFFWDVDRRLGYAMRLVTWNCAGLSRRRCGTSVTRGSCDQPLSLLRLRLAIQALYVTNLPSVRNTN